MPDVLKFTNYRLTTNFAIKNVILCNYQAFTSKFIPGKLTFKKTAAVLLQ